MTMTTLGKILVFLNVAISGLLLAWAVNLYTHRIDWTDKAASGDKPAGELVARKGRVDDMQKNALPAALVGWNNARAELQPLEARRSADRAFYQAVMTHLATAATADNASRELKFVNGRVVLDKNGLPDVSTEAKDRRGNKLLSYNYYLREQDKAYDALNKVLDDYKALIEKDSQLTDLMLGPQGLQQQMVEERDKRNDLIKEEDAVRPLLLNSAVEYELLGKRQKQLEGRVTELRKAN
jgi:hypothetical protein